MAAVSYSLWLLPDSGELQQKLDGVVDRMAQEFSSSRFDFHVTLLGGIKSDNLPEPSAAWAFPDQEVSGDS